MLQDVRNKIRIALLARWMPATVLERQLGPLHHCHNEWSVISDQLDDAQRASPELIDVALDAIQLASRSPARLVEQRSANHAVRVWPGEHYRLLPALCEAFRARHIVEIGTWQGDSALAFLGSSVVEHVDTFDIVPWRDIEGTELQSGDFGPRLTQHIGDIRLQDVFDEHRTLLSHADLLFIDGPKDGTFEQMVVPRLLELPPRRRLIVLDDIRVLSMIELWRQLPPPKLDVTSFGHWSGTGLLLRT